MPKNIAELKAAKTKLKWEWLKPNLARIVRLAALLVAFLCIVLGWPIAAGWVFAVVVIIHIATPFSAPSFGNIACDILAPPAVLLFGLIVGQNLR